MKHVQVISFCSLGPVFFHTGVSVCVCMCMRVVEFIIVIVFVIVIVIFMLCSPFCFCFSSQQHDCILAMPLVFHLAGLPDPDLGQGIS